jgi:hypothetical protein
VVVLVVVNDGLLLHTQENTSFPVLIPSLDLKLQQQAEEWFQPNNRKHENQIHKEINPRNATTPSLSKHVPNRPGKSALRAFWLRGKPSHLHPSSSCTAQTRCTFAYFTQKQGIPNNILLRRSMMGRR